MRLELIIPLFSAFPVGLIFFLLLTRRIETHLKDIKDKIAFFFWPYPPSRMLIIQELDGSVNIYYDDEFQEIQAEDKTLVQTIDGNEYITEVPPSQASKAISTFDAKAPEGYPSPFAAAWRWIVAASIMIYLIYYAVVVAVIPPIETETIEIGFQKITVAHMKEIDMMEVLLTVTLFSSFIVWYISNIMRMNDKTIAYAWYHAKGINPPHISIIPSPSLSNISLLDYLEKLGRKIEIVVPKEAEAIVSKALREIEKKTGSKSLAAVILAKLAIAKAWRQALAQVLRERFDMRKAGEAAAMIRVGVQPITRRIIPLLLIVGLLAFTFGYLVGNTFSVGVAPAANNTMPMQPGYNYSVPPNQGNYNYSVPETPPTSPATTPPIQPAQPPPPPTGGKP